MIRACTCTGLQERHRTVVQHYTFGGTPCEGSKIETKECTPDCEPPSENCAVGQWSNVRLEEEEDKTPEEILVANVGKLDPKRHLERSAEDLLTLNISHTLTMMINTVIF